MDAYFHVSRLLLFNQKRCVFESCLDMTSLICAFSLVNTKEILMAVQRIDFSCFKCLRR
jgi:hypothetical protein